jgi:hypothetical protein
VGVDDCLHFKVNGLDSLGGNTDDRASYRRPRHRWSDTMDVANNFILDGPDKC